MGKRRPSRFICGNSRKGKGGKYRISWWVLCRTRLYDAGRGSVLPDEIVWNEISTRTFWNTPKSRMVFRFFWIQLGNPSNFDQIRSQIFLDNQNYMELRYHISICKFLVGRSRWIPNYHL